MKQRLKPAQLAFREALAKAGVDAAALDTLARELEKVAAAHLWLANKRINAPEDAAAQRANDAVEAWAQHLIAEHPGLTGLRFMGDPRGETVGLQLATGDSNSFTGTWKIPVDERDFAQVSQAQCEHYIQAVEDLNRDASDSPAPSF